MHIQDRNLKNGILKLLLGNWVDDLKQLYKIDVTFKEDVAHQKIQLPDEKRELGFDLKIDNQISIITVELDTETGDKFIIEDYNDDNKPTMRLWSSKLRKSINLVKG